MNETRKSIGFFALLLVFILSAVYLSNIIDEWAGKSKQPTEQSYYKPMVECPADSFSYNIFIEQEHKTLELISGETPMFAANGKFVNLQRIVSKSETKESKVACGYIEIVAGTKDNGALQSWENVYINPNGFGGHINIDNQIGLGDSNTNSNYVLPLNMIEYWKTRADRIRGNLLEADWASLLNVSDKIIFEIAFNSNNKSGFISKVNIYYTCWNPITGEINNKCNLSVVDENQTESSTPIN